MEYPDEKLTALSKYSHAEICTTLDQWHEVEGQFNAAINAVVDYYALPTDLLKAIDDLEPIVCPMDGMWRRAGNTERFPVKKWQKLIRQHKQLVSQIQTLQTN